MRDKRGRNVVSITSVELIYHIKRSESIYCLPEPHVWQLMLRKVLCFVVYRHPRGLFRA
jgi:hypothetical protein